MAKFTKKINVSIEEFLDALNENEKTQLLKLVVKDLSESTIRCMLGEVDSLDDETPRERAIDFFRDFDLYGQRSFLVDALYVPSAVMEDALRRELEPIIAAR